MDIPNVWRWIDVSWTSRYLIFMVQVQGPRLVPSGQMLVPFYDMIHQVGIEA